MLDLLTTGKPKIFTAPETSKIFRPETRRVLESFASPTLALRLFTSKHCSQLVGLRLRGGKIADRFLAYPDWWEVHTRPCEASLLPAITRPKTLHWFHEEQRH